MGPRWDKDINMFEDDKQMLRNSLGNSFGEPVSKDSHATGNYPGACIVCSACDDEATQVADAGQAGTRADRLHACGREGSWKRNGGASRVPNICVYYDNDRVKRDGMAPAMRKPLMPFCAAFMLSLYRFVARGKIGTGWRECSLSLNPFPTGAELLLKINIHI